MNHNEETSVLRLVPLNRDGFLEDEDEHSVQDMHEDRAAGKVAVAGCADLPETIISTVSELTSNSWLLE